MPLGSIKGSAYPYASNRAVVTNRRGIQRGMSAVYHQSWPTAAFNTAKVTNGISTIQAGPNTATINLLINGSLASGGKATLLPGYGPFANGRNVVVTVTHATAVVAVSGIISGIDVYGVSITEAWSVTAGGTSKTYTGLKAFKVVTGVTVTAVADASADSVIVGDGDLLGLDVANEIGSASGLANSAVKEVMDATILTTGLLTVAGITISNAGVISISSTADRRGTYAPAAILNGTHVYDLWYISDIPEFSGGA